MVFTKYQVTNNAESTLLASISASATSLIIQSSEGALFPSTFPFKLVLEKFNSDTVPKVIKREIVECTNRSWDTFTIVRASEWCVQDETAIPKTNTNNGLSFDSGDKVSLYDTKDQRDDMQNEIERLETDKLDKSTYDSEKNVMNVSTASGWTTYQYNDSSITAYTETRTYRVKADVDNTGACTFEINSLWALPVRNLQGTEDLTAWEWKQNGIATLVYNSSLNVFQFSWQEATVVVPSVKSTIITLTAWENLSQWDALYINSWDWSVYKTDDSDNSKINFIWFASESAISSNPVNINISWINENQSWLSIWLLYYLLWTIEWYRFDLLSYDSKFLWVSESTPFWLYFNNDWTKFYVIWSTLDRVDEYIMSTAWDVSTWSFNANFSVSAQTSQPTWVIFSPDWLNMYITENVNDRVYQYTLTTAFNISTASYASKFFSFNSQDTIPRDIRLNSIWTKMYMAWQSGNNVYQYSLWTAFDVSTASYDSVSFSVSAQESAVFWLEFNDDLSKMLVWWNSQSWYQYTLSTPWDLSTASYDSISFSFSSQDTIPTALKYWNNWANLYMAWDQNNRVYQYSSFNSTPWNAWKISTEMWINSVLVWKATKTTDILINSGWF